MTKKSFLYTCLLLLLIVASLTFFLNKNKPNVIFILLDAARSDHFSCYGYNRNTTPYIDAISREGVVFQNNFSQGPHTTASLKSIFFSRYFSKSIVSEGEYMWGIKQEWPESLSKELDTEQIFLTDIFSLNGYRTALFSQHPFFKNNSYFANRFDSYFTIDTSWKKINYYLEQNNQITEGIKSWISENKGQSFFVYWHVFPPHRPYFKELASKEFLKNINEDVFASVFKKIDIDDKRLSLDYSYKELECLKGLYDSNLKYADSLVGILYKELKRAGILDKTVIIITADHGENLGQHGYVWHTSSYCWDSVIRVPLIIAYPPLVPKGLKVKGWTESVDIMPTILDICGIKLPKGKSMDGVSLLKFLQHPKEGKKTVFATDTIRTGGYKYLLNKDELYNISKDPNELKDLSKVQPLLKEKLKRRYDLIMRPYNKRYMDAKRDTPPDYPFYFSSGIMNKNPREYVKKCSVSSSYEFLKENTVTKPWLFNDYFGTQELIPVSSYAFPQPITLSALLPDGVYNIYILLKSRKEIKYTIEELGFKYRFNPEGQFIYPEYLKLFKRLEEDTVYYYLGLGPVAVKDKKFSVEIDFRPPKGELYAIEHIKFVPEGCKETGGNNISGKTQKEQDAEFKTRVKSLKSLGYM